MRFSINKRILLVAMSLVTLSFLWSTQVWAQEGGGEEALREGAQLYIENCAVCHGEQGEGQVGPTLAKDWPSIRPDLSIKAVIVDGVAGSAMPAWSQENGGPLNDSAINDLVAFILSLSEEPIVEIELTPTVTVTPYPVPVDLLGSSTGIVIGAFIVVLVVIIGVFTFSKRN